MPGGKRRELHNTSPFSWPSKLIALLLYIKKKKKSLKKPCYCFKFFRTFLKKERLTSKKGC